MPLPAPRGCGEIASHVLDLESSLVTEPTAGKSAPRISAAVALTLLEVIRFQDAPTEVLESEDPSHTMPRRLGLSGRD